MNSWDVFDTLLARKFINPKTVFDEVGRRIGDPEFKKKRIQAEKQTKKTEGDYWDIYKLLPKYDPQVELAVEFEHNYPIVENIQRVQDGDLMLSDMYLPADFIMSMLRNCGLTADVDIIVTRYGKKHGYIWDRVKQEYPNLENHYGDNHHSDVKSALANGVNGVLVEQHKLTENEQLVYSTDKHLAALMRYTRLHCPYTGEQQQFWNDQSNINIPMLLIASNYLPDKKIAFSYRDCRNWHVLYEALTGKKGIALRVSRNTWLNPTVEFNEYIKHTIDDNTAIVDLQGKARSIWTYFQKQPPHTIYIGGKTQDYVENLTGVATKVMEKMNCLDQPTVVAYNTDGPVFAKHNDHPIEVAQVQMQAVDFAAQSLNDFKIKASPIETLVELVNRMKKSFTGRNIEWAKFNGLD